LFDSCCFGEGAMVVSLAGRCAERLVMGESEVGGFDSV
jgi:hypothetical protein